jgi:tetratricopeptide (TPR) repeat protein
MIRVVMLQEVGDRHHQAATWDSLGYAHHHLGRYPRAIECYEKAIALYRDVRDRAFEADTLKHLGDTQHAAGDPAAARASWQEALDTFTEIGHQDAETLRNKLDCFRPA